MKSASLLTAGALAILLSGAANAQTQPPAPNQAPMPAQGSAAPQIPTTVPVAAPVNPPVAGAPAASDAAAPTAAVAQDPAAPLGSNANPLPQSSPTPPGQASNLMAGDPTVVSNGPVPDTKANRAKYGQPLSASGRATRPAGN
jgi:hypothetical protein